MHFIIYIIQCKRISQLVIKNNNSSVWLKYDPCILADHLNDAPPSGMYRNQASGQVNKQNPAVSLIQYNLLLHAT